MASKAWLATALDQIKGYEFPKNPHVAYFNTVETVTSSNFDEPLHPAVKKFLLDAAPMRYKDTLKECNTGHEFIDAMLDEGVLMDQQAYIGLVQVTFQIGLVSAGIIDCALFDDSDPNIYNYPMNVVVERVPLLDKTPHNHWRAYNSKYKSYENAVDAWNAREFVEIGQLRLSGLKGELDEVWVRAPIKWAPGIVPIAPEYSLSR